MYPQRSVYDVSSCVNLASTKQDYQGIGVFFLNLFSCSSAEKEHFISPAAVGWERERNPTAKQEKV